MSSPQSWIHVLPPCGWPLLCLRLYRNEHGVTLDSHFLLRFLPPQKHCYFKTPGSRPTGGSQLTSLARNARDLCYGRRMGRAAVQIGQTVDILGMCKWSQLLAEGAERCQGSAAGGVWRHELHAHTQQNLQSSSWGLWSKIMQCDFAFLFYKI